MSVPLVAHDNSLCQAQIFVSVPAGIGPQGVSFDPRPPRRVFKGLHGSIVRAIFTAPGCR